MSGRSYYFEYDAAHKVLALRVTGDVTDEIFEACYAATVRQVAGRDVRAVLSDLSEVSGFDVTAAGIRHASTLDPVLPDPTPRYVIAPHDHVFGMARMFQLVSSKERDTLHVVRSRYDAYAALGLTAPQFERLPDLPST